MTSSANPATGKAPWSVLGPEVPDDLAGKRVLEIQGGGESEATEALRGRGAAELVRWRFPEPLENPGEPFDLAYCAGALQGDPHPMNLLTRIWHLTRTGGTLLLESQVLTATEISRYGLFVNDPGGASRWVPGRLALRWMVESSGFDVDRWIDEGARGADAPEAASASLRATRTDRAPALDLANPHNQEGA
jgi:hypothetical protein